MEENTQDYKEMIGRLEQLVAAIESPEHPLENIQAELKEASDLAARCLEYLKGTEENLNKIIG